MVDGFRFAPVVNLEPSAVCSLVQAKLEDGELLGKLREHAPHEVEQPVRPRFVGEVLCAVGRQQAGVGAVIALGAVDTPTAKAREILASSQTAPSSGV